MTTRRTALALSACAGEDGKAADDRKPAGEVEKSADHAVKAPPKTDSALGGNPP
ncbi:hypothetical protein [Streptomyces sp. NPDC054808]